MEKVLLIALSLSSIGFVSAMPNPLAIARQKRVIREYGIKHNPVLFKANEDNVVMTKNLFPSLPRRTK